MITSYTLSFASDGSEILSLFVGTALEMKLPLCVAADSVLKENKSVKDVDCSVTLWL
jgi:hypothetical protein